MSPEIGEYAVGAYLRIIEQCDVVDFNVKPLNGGVEGLRELDVIGFKFKNDKVKNNTVYICEVTTHIRGMLIENNVKTIDTVRKKFKIQKEHCSKYLNEFPEKHIMFWSPVVPRGILTDGLKSLEEDGLEVIINEEYTKRMDKLVQKAKKDKSNTGNPFYRSIQLLESLKR